MHKDNRFRMSSLNIDALAADWKANLIEDSRIEPIPVGEKQFAEDHTNMIIELARREGQIISLAD